MIQVVNREPAAGQAGRVKLTLDDGTVLEGVLSMDDGASPEGTPWNAQTGRLLQADIRTYPAATAITAGDVVDISNGQATTDGTPGQGIALQTVQAGADVDVIFSGATAAEWAEEGQTIDSPGVQGFAPVDGMLLVTSSRDSGLILCGRYTGNGNEVESQNSQPDITQKINLPATPKVLFIIRGNDSHADAFGLGNMIVIPYGETYKDTYYGETTVLEIVEKGFKVTSTMHYVRTSKPYYSESSPRLNTKNYHYIYAAII